MVNEQLTIENDQWSMVNGQLAMGSKKILSIGN